MWGDRWCGGGGGGEWRRGSVEGRQGGGEWRRGSVEGREGTSSFVKSREKEVRQMGGRRGERLQQTLLLPTASCECRL